MTPAEFLEEVKKIDNTDDPEKIHLAMDELMMRCLREKVYGAGVDVLDQLERWYA